MEETAMGGTARGTSGIDPTEAPRPRPDLAAAQGAPGDQGIRSEARLPALDAGDRRGCRPDEHVERLVPAEHAAEEGVLAPGRGPAADRRGAPARPPGRATGPWPRGGRGRRHSRH